MTTILAPGDVVWVDLDPVRGSEQSGYRPAMVLTDENFNLMSARSIVCPISGNATAWPTKVFLPADMQTRGAVLADQPRAVHRSERGFHYIEKAPEDVLRAVRAVLEEILGMSGRATGPTPCLPR